MDPALPTVVLVHGAMDRAASFGRVMRRLPELDVVSYDRRGYDRSLSAGVAASLADHTEDLRSVLDWTGSGRWVVVGHSLGGTIALLLASEPPSGLSSVGVFEAPVPSLPGYRADAGDAALAAARAAGSAAAAESFYRMLVGDRTWERLRPADRERRLAEGEALVAELRDLRRPESWPPIDQIRLPVVVGVGGEGSDYWQNAARTLCDRLRSAHLDVVAGAGHGAHLSHPDDFARYVSDAVRAAGEPGGTRG